MGRLGSDHTKNDNPRVDRIDDANEDGQDGDQGAESEYHQDVRSLSGGDLPILQQSANERIHSRVQEKMHHVPAVFVGKKAVAYVAFRVEGEKIICIGAAVGHRDIEVGRHNDGEDKEDRQEQAFGLLPEKSAGSPAVEGARDKVAGDQEEESHEEGHVNRHEAAKPHGSGTRIRIDPGSTRRAVGLGYVVGDDEERKAELHVV